MVNVAVFMVSELLCFVVKNYKRFDKSAIIDIISKFYHDDELYAAKVELNKHFATVSGSAEVPVIDGWSKLTNKQGLPVARKAGDASQRRVAEAEDVLQMMTLLDISKSDLPTFVAADLDRIPALHTSGMHFEATKLASSVEELHKKVDAVEQKVSTHTATLSTDATLLQRLASIE